MKRIKQMFCKHEFDTYKETDFKEHTDPDYERPKFFNISGERYVIGCSRCGKIKSSFFAEH